MAKKYYAVKNGRVPGIYFNWADCKNQVDGFAGAVYKGFDDISEAEAFIGGAGYTKATPKAASKGETPLELPDTYAFTDGSYNIVTMVYGFGGFVHVNGEDIPVRGHGSDPEVVGSRNVAGEVYGAVAAMKKAIELGVKEITLFYDYEGVEKWPTKQWQAKKPISMFYVEEYEKIKEQLKVNFEHVKAHTGIPGNEAADKMAKEEAGVE